jgi:hypothetical protein
METLRAVLALFLEGLGKALQSKVVIPQLGEALLLLVKRDKMHIVRADNVATPLLNSGVVVPVILCEVPDYVK